MSPGVISEGREDVAILKLVESIRLGHPVILCVDNWDHWVTAFGLLGPMTIHVADSADSELVKHYEPGELLARWKGPGKKAFYGIVV